MIHTVLVTPQTTPDELRKAVRKKLMTGGAVLRLDSALEDRELRQLYEVHSTELHRHSLSAQVLCEIAIHPNTADDVLEKLRELTLPEIQRALSKRPPPGS